MDSKIRVPRLRSVLLAMAGLVVVFLWVTHHNAQREIANQRATGLGAVATGWDPIGLWQESSFSTFVSSPRKVSGVVGGVPGGLSGGVIGGRILTVRSSFERS